MNDDNPWEHLPSVADVLTPVADACPSFGDLWSGWTERNPRFAAGADGCYVLLELSQHLLDRLRAGDTGTFAATFAVLDDMLESANTAFAEMLGVHFIRDLQHAGLSSGDWGHADLFVPFLGPRLLAGWRLSRRSWEVEQGMPPSMRPLAPGGSNRRQRRRR